MSDTSEFPPPRLVVSRCLGFEACRYNGQMLLSDVVEALKPAVEIVTVCPEVQIGLGIPRDPIRIALDGDEEVLFQPSTDRDVTEAMRAYGAEFVAGAGEVDGFLLKARSPSCGPHDVKVYRSTARGAPAGKGVGLFAQAVRAGRPGTPLEDEGRLTNLALRDHFLTAVYALRRFRDVVAAGKMGALVAFHASHKYLLMAYHQGQLRELGPVVANHDRRPADEVLAAYGDGLRAALAHPFRYTSMINALQHMFGHVSDGLSAEERKFFLDTIEEYRDERVPLQAPLRLLHAWAVRFDERYLLGQALLRPYPPDLVDLFDSARGKRLRDGR